MKINVIYQGVFPPKKGASGADRRVRSIVRGIAQDSNSVEMLIPANRNPSKENKDKDEYSIHYLGTSMFKNFLFIGKIAYWFSVLKYVITNKVDLVLFYGTSMEGIPIAYLLRLIGTKVVYELCDLPSSSLKGFGKFRNELAENVLPKCTNLNIVISDFLETHVKKMAPKTPTLKIPILVDSDLFITNANDAESIRVKYNIKKDDILLAYAGGTWKEEGVIFLLEAFKILSNEYSNIRLIIAGKLAESIRHDDIKGFVEKNNISDKIITTGWIGTDELTGVYSAADILVLPQIQHQFNQAGLPTKLAEYSAMGKSIVATKVGDVTLYFDHKVNSILCEPSNVSDLKEALELIITDQTLRTEIGKNAKITANKFFDYRVAGFNMLEAFSKL